MIRAVILAIPLALCAIEAGAAPLVAAELNKLEPQGDACRAYLVLKNEVPVAFDTLKLDLVLFDGDGVVARRLAVDAAPLAAGKTSLKVFDIAGQACGAIGRILLNDVIACAGPDGPRSDCLGLVAPSARGSVQFIK
jgi:hypothetical protein